MNGHHISTWCLVAALVIFGTRFGSLKAIAQSAQADVEDGVEVLTRGPVHEAFAETVTFDPKPGFVVPGAPPEAIEEVPPEQRPEGDNVAWIPGYWSWDDERSDFVWVSGIWRNLPPGRQWVPGYWGESGQDYQWTSGYWADATVSEVEYLPEPPATVEAGPNVAAPSTDHIWAPGSWIWNQSRYAWRPGYWESAQPDWTWVPAHYVWAPRGYVFVDGYYDYSVDRRGVLFAPVYFNASVYSRPGFYYSPATVINPAVFVSQLFLRPHYQHYYFGDYYADNYSSAGFHPWFSYNSSRYGYDPIYAHERWHHRQDREWEQNVRADFQHRRDHEDARPPRTWAAQKALMTREAHSAQKSFVVAAPLAQLATNKESPLRFQPVDREERQRLAKHGQEIQKFRQERQKLETRAGKATTDPAKQVEPARVKLPKSPIFAKATGEPGKDRAPPKAHETPQLDPKFKPKPRVAEQPRPHTTNRRPLDTEPNVPPRGKSPRAGADTPGPERDPRVDQPIPQPPTTPRVDRRTPQPQRQPKVDRQPPTQRVDRPDRQPQSQPRVDRPQPQPRVERSQPQPPPKVKRSSQPQPPPRVNQPASQTQSRVNRSAQSQPQPKVDRSSQRQPQPRIKQPHPQSMVDRPTPQPRSNPAAPPRGSADSPTADPQSDKHNRKSKE